MIRNLVAFLLLVRPVLSENTTCDEGPVLVVGATGATGKHVVRQLLDQQKEVRVVARSKTRVLDLIGPNVDTARLQITEAGLLDLNTTELQDLVDGTSAVVSCLGHNLNLQGIFGQPRKLVTVATQRLTDAMLASTLSSGCSNPKKYILMNSDGVAHPNDPPRPTAESIIIWLIRQLIPPHSDNEGAAKYLLDDIGTDRNLQWVVVRPTNLVDAEQPTSYKLYKTPHGSLFGGNVVSRATVAKFMVDLLTDESLWITHKFKYPVVHDVTQPKPDSEL